MYIQSFHNNISAIKIHNSQQYRTFSGFVSQTMDCEVSSYRYAYTFSKVSPKEQIVYVLTVPKSITYYGKIREICFPHARCFPLATSSRRRLPSPSSTINLEINQLTATPIPPTFLTKIFRDKSDDLVSLNTPHHSFPLQHHRDGESIVRGQSLEVSR